MNDIAVTKSCFERLFGSPGHAFRDGISQDRDGRGDVEHTESFSRLVVEQHPPVITEFLFF